MKIGRRRLRCVPIGSVRPPEPMTIKIPTLFLHTLFSAVCVASDALEEPVLFGDAFSSDDAVSCGMPDLLFSE